MILDRRCRSVACSIGSGTATPCTGATLPGVPDLVFPSRRKIVFVHGCFWHQHKRCIDGRVPKVTGHLLEAEVAAQCRARPTEHLEAAA